MLRYSHSMFIFYLIFGSLLLSSMLHFATAPERFAHASFLIGSLYLMLGVFQFVLALGFLIYKNLSWAQVIYVSCLLLFILFVLNQIFGGQLVVFIKEPYTLPTIMRKLFEIAAGICSMYFVRRQKKSPTPMSL